jgi:hypothetical protein
MLRRMYSLGVTGVPRCARLERVTDAGNERGAIRENVPAWIRQTCDNLQRSLSRAVPPLWRDADAVMDYWHASMKMDTAISRVQNCDAPEGNLHPTRDPKDYWTVEKYRIAWARMMLTPAPDMQSVAWKRAQLKADNHKSIAAHLREINTSHPLT